jgi:cell division protease FtsH
MDATVIIVSGPELKSKWVGESEENLRRVFRQARRSAPAVVVFDEIDAFAHARGTYQGSGVEHSMVNQLLTEMDGFRGSESVFVVGTTNFLESLDGALLRPGRFEFLIEIPAPNVHDRREIVAIYDRKLELGLSTELQEHMVRRTEGLAERERGLPFTGDHIYAVCRALKRQQLRTGERNFGPDDIDRALQRKTRAQVVLSPAEERVVAIHEAGHALLAMLVEHATPPERISIAADMEGALGYVLRAARARPYAITSADMRADICVGLGGMCAERLVLGEVSIGAHTDLQQVNRIARAMVEEYGMGATTGALVRLDEPHHRGDAAVSERRRERVDAEVGQILEQEQTRAHALLAANQPLLASLVETLLARKVLDRAELRALTQGGPHG